MASNLSRPSGRHELNASLNGSDPRWFKCDVLPCNRLYCVHRIFFYNQLKEMSQDRERWREKTMKRHLQLPTIIEEDTEE